MTNWKDVRDVVQHGAALEKQRQVPLRLAVAGSEGELLRAVLALLTPMTSRAVVDCIVVDGHQEVCVDEQVELAVIACETVPKALADLIEQARRRRVEFFVVRAGAQVQLARPSDEALRQLGVGDAVDLDLGTDRVADQLFEVVLKRLVDKKLALCANFEGARIHAAKEVINHTAWQNCAIAGIVVIPGADMPLLTGNQIKMVLELAAIYGKEMTFARAKELIAVIGAGFTFRTIARELLGFVPGPGWTVKASVAYFGTVATGRAAQQYLLHGDEWASAARAQVGRARRRLKRDQLPRHNTATETREPGTSAR